MKVILFLAAIISLGVALATTKFTSSTPKPEDKKLIATELPTTKEVGKILGETVKQVEQEIQQKPQKFVEQTATNVINQVSSDATSLSNNIINSIISQQVLNTYKSLSPEAKSHVQEAICK
ncbi:hypothetical protein HY030_02120 [Candidatus Gottesmanbacteria bacterium]|nr:hypothetical protein [Candidatus Gottesmanbacteria bacterium]